MVAIKTKYLILSLLLFVIFVERTFAEMMEKGKTRVKTLLNLYRQDSDQGKQVFDNSGNETVNVIEPMIFVKHQIDETTEVNGHFVYDLWTAESDTIIDAQTGASGEGKKKQPRTAPNIGIQREVSKRSYGMNLGYSNEYDYQSKNISMNLSDTFADDNFTLGGSLQYFADTVDLFPDLTVPRDATIKKGHPREIWAATLGASQILTRHDLLSFGITVARANGRLESTAGTVNLSGTRTLERLPSNRFRKATDISWNHALTEESATSLSYRYYFDDWNSSAHTARLALLFSINDDQDLFECAVRYHRQESVEYYKDSFTTRAQFMTSDSDMSRFSSVEASTYYSQTLADFSKYSPNFHNVEWGNGATFGKRNSGLSYGYLQTSFLVTF